jgi:hypothetical protein
MRSFAMLSRGHASAIRLPLLPVMVFALAVMAAPASASNNVPDWVKKAAAQPLPEYSQTTKAVVLLNDTIYTVGAKGQATEHVRFVIKILRPQGRSLAMPAVWYDKDSRINSFHVWSIDPAGHEYAMKDSEYVDYSSPGEGGKLYVDERARVAEPPGRDPGGVIAYEYDRTERPYLGETSWMFQDETPRLEQSFTLALPAGFSYTTTWAHHPSVSGADLENHSYRWEMNNEPGIDLEHVPLAPSGGALAARMTVHYTGPGMDFAQEGDWKGIGLWYEGLIQNRFTPSAEITAKATELTAGKTDFYDKAEAIGVFLQQHIRYFVVEIGIGGYQPHPAADIFHVGYGDCKDKATLLSSMLSAVGIHSALLLVDTQRGVIDPDDPSIVGNHMIGAIEIPVGYQSLRLHSVVTTKTGKRYLIFDPTWTETPFGQIADNLQGSYALLLEGPDSEILHLPSMPPELNTVMRTGTFALQADGTLKGTVTEKWFGDVAMPVRHMATEEDSKEQERRMNRVVARDFGAVALSGITFTDAGTLSKDVVTTFTLQADHFAAATGPLLMVRPRVLGSYALNVDRKVRTVSIDLEQTMQGHDEFDIELPPGYAVDELPDPVNLDLGFAAYQSKTELRGQTLHYTRTYTQRELMLPASKYREIQRLTATIGADEDGRVILKRVAAPPPAVATTLRP